MTLRTLLSLVAAMAILLVATAGVASAHKTTYTPDGKVKIVWGFLNEPAVTYSKTGLDLILSDNATGAPIEGSEKTLNASLVLGDAEHDFVLSAQHGQKGRYTDVVTLTRPGLYSLRLQGTVNGSAVDLTIPAAHEIKDVSETYFPDAPSMGEMQADIAALKAKVGTQSATPAPVTDQNGGGNPVPAPGLAIILAALGVAALVAMRRRG